MFSRIVCSTSVFRSNLFLPPNQSRSSSTTPDIRKEIIYKSSVPPLALPQENLVTLIFDAAKKRSHLPAIECIITGRQYTYGQMVDGSLRWATALLRLTGRNDRDRAPTVGIFCRNCPEYPIMVFGALAAGSIVTTISTAYTDVEVSRQITDSELEVLIVGEELERVADQAVSTTKRNIKVVVNGMSKNARPNFQQLISESRTPFAEPIQNQLSDIAILPYSSGTTGNPKGVALSHGAVSSNVIMYSHPNHYTFRTPTSTFQDKSLGLVPMYHIYGLHGIMMISIYNGVKIISLPEFHPDTFLKAIRDHKIGVLNLVPPLLNFLVNSPKVNSKDLSSVRAALCGAAPVSATDAQAFKDKVPNPVFFQEAYGMTEAMLIHISSLKKERLGTCGELIPNVECKLVHLSTGESLPPGQPGEIWIQSPSIMSHYHGNQKATSETIDKEGWLHTGDVAFVDEEGYFTIVDRIKELIKVKGLQVAPTEIEEVLLQHPSVADVGVVGVPDERAGELPRAYVVLRQKGTTAEELHHWTSSRLAAYKQLKGGIHFVDELPKNQTGKLLRRKLTEMFNIDRNVDS